MATIQPIQAQRGIETGGVPNTRIDDSVGQGLRVLGGALSNAASAQQALDLRKEQLKFQNEEFRTDQAFRRWSDDMALEYSKAEQDIDPSGEGFTEKVSGQFNVKAGEFLETVPEALRPRFSEIVTTARETWLNKASAAEIDQRNNWFRTGITESQEKLQTQVFNDPALFEAALEDGNRAIDTSGLPAKEKEELRKSWRDTLAITLGEREKRDAESDPMSAQGAAQRLGVSGAVSTTDNGGDAMSLLREFEGFRTTPYWDVNAYRTGYGSDTITRADGSVVRVTKGMRVSRADAERDLARRTKEFEARARKQVGAREWGAMPPHVQAALVSVAYNYGSLPANVANAVKTGNIEAIAAAVESRGSDNEGVNRSRRSREASIIRGGAGIASNRPDLAGEPGTDPRYESLSLSQRLAIYDQVQAAAQRGQTAIDAQRKAAYDAAKGALELGIQTGDVSSVQQIMQSNMRDDDKASLLSALRTRQGDQMALAEAVTAFQNGTLRTDPYSTDDRKKVDGIHDVIGQSVPQDQQQAATDNLIAQTGIVPQKLHNAIRAGLESQNIEEVERAAQQAARIGQINPAALARRDGGTEMQKRADDFNYYVNNLNMTPQQAAQRLADMNDPQKQRDRKALEPAAKEFRKTLENEDLGAVFDDSILPFNDPQVGFTEAERLGITAEYNAIAEEQFYLTGGNTELAKNRAKEEMKRLYGVTTISGKSTVMKHPPDRYWPAMPGSDPFGYVREQIADEFSQFVSDDDISGWFPTNAARAAALPEMKRQMIMDSLIIRATPETDAMVKAGKMPAYFVGYVDPNGNIQTIPGKLFVPDVSAVHEESQRVTDQEVEWAREDDADMRIMQDSPDGGRGQSLDSFIEGPTMLPRMEVPVTDPDTPANRIQGQRQELFDNAQDSGLFNGAMP